MKQLSFKKNLSNFLCEDLILNKAHLTRSQEGQD